MPATRTVLTVEHAEIDATLDAEAARGERVTVPSVCVTLSCGHAFRVTGTVDDDPDPRLRTPQVGDSFPCSSGACDDGDEPSTPRP